MIDRTFLFLSGITRYRQNSFREQNILTWDDFLSMNYIEGISFRKKSLLDQQVLKAKMNLECRNAPFFYEHIPKNEQWRLYPHFKSSCAFLDIETTGLSPDRNRITTICVYDGNETKVFIRGQNLNDEELDSYLRRFKMLVTFNGAMFDLPFIQKHFPKVNLCIPHMDLRWTAKKIGLTGGLKAIEKTIGLCREGDMDGMDGSDAVRLWKKWEIRGDRDALDTLVRYNTEDVVNLKILADHVFDRLKEAEESDIEGNKSAVYSAVAVGRRASGKNMGAEDDSEPEIFCNRSDLNKPDLNVSGSMIR